MNEFAPHDADSAPLLQIRRTRDDRGPVLELRGELDISTAPALRRELIEAVRDEPSRVVIDLTHLDFMDSTGLALVVDARKSAEAAGHALRLRPGSPQVQRLFILTGVLDQFEFEECRAI